jgi:hypothetical protein
MCKDDIGAEISTATEHFLQVDSWLVVGSTYLTWDRIAGLDEE